MRRRAWQGRELPLEPERWPAVADGRTSAHQDVEVQELLHAIRRAMETELTAHQREVFTALALNEVPIDVLAERLATTRAPSTRRCTTPGAGCAPGSSAKG